MSLLEYLSSFFGPDEQFSLEYDDPVNGMGEITFTKAEFYDFLNHGPNLHEEHLNQLLNEGDIDPIAPHLDGVVGNLMAQKYFTGMGGEVAPEVSTDDGIIDMIVSPSDTMHIVKIVPGKGGIELESESLDDSFAVEVKNYSGDSFHLTDPHDIGEQLLNGAHSAHHSYLGVTKDFLNLDWSTQKEIIDMAEANGNGVILLPYDKISLDDTLNNLLNQIS